MPPKPIQARAQRRRESLLDAAAALLEREGHDAVNTNAIAAEAGTAIGTVYHYFPNKPALLQALLERYQERLERVLMTTLLPALDGSVEALAEAGVRAFAEFYANEPGYAELWLGSQLSGPLRDAGAAWGDHFSEMFGQLLAQRRSLPESDARRRAEVLVHAVSAVVSLAVQRGDDERDALVEEAVALAKAYL